MIELIVYGHTDKIYYFDNCDELDHFIRTHNPQNYIALNLYGQIIRQQDAKEDF